MSWKEFTKGVDFDIKWGLKGVKISLFILILIKIILITYFIKNVGGWEEIFKAIMRIPKTLIDYMAILAGIIIFISVPFLIGVKIGLQNKNKK